MENSSKDDLADALTKLASGDIAPSEELPPHPQKATRAALPTIKPIDMPEEEREPSEEMVEDEELVMAPDTAEDMVHSPRAARPVSFAAVHRAPLYQTLKFRQTIIPILLTCGLLTLFVASLKFVLPPDSLFSDLPLWIPIALLLTGITQLALAAVNMLSVKSQLTQAR